MKEEILRRAEEISDSEDEEEDGGKGKGRDLAYEDELEDADVVKVRDGDPSDLEGDEEEVDGDAEGTEVSSFNCYLSLKEHGSHHIM